VSGAVVWFTGLPRSGKTTLAHATHAALQRCGLASIILDGDAVRSALRPTPGYEPEARAAFYQTLAHLAGLIAAQGSTVLVPATAHRRVFREQARALAPRFVEVHVATTVEDCVARDSAGLYADDGTRAALPGAGVEYEPPLEPDVVAHGGHDERAVDHLLALLAPLH
jgi:adenylylsulfate kinase